MVSYAKVETIQFYLSMIVKKVKSFISKKTSKKNIRPWYIAILISFILVIPLILGLLIYNAKFAGHIFPNIYIADVNVGNLTENEAQEKMISHVSDLNTLKLRVGSQTFDVDLAESGFVYDFNDSIYRAYNFARTGNFFTDTVTRVQLLSDKKNLGISVHLDEENLKKQLINISDKIAEKPVQPSIRLENKQIIVDPGKPGTEIDYPLLRTTVGLNLSKNNLSEIDVPITSIDNTLTENQVEDARKRAEKYVGKSITFKFEYNEFTYKDNDLVKFINPRSGFNQDEISRLIFNLASSVNRGPQNPKFQFDGTKVSEFSPAIEGVTLNSPKLTEQFREILTKLEASEQKNIALELPVTRVSPEIATQEVNNLGIKEMIGRGSSTYFHSIPGRVFNVNLAASRINGVLVKPGETFSFNSALGDVSKLSGYKEAYVITGGKTVLGDGGGVCQVSSTLFRAVLNAGLPVTERSSHAYRVGYYEQNSPPGMDATVYSPRPDFKFTNDTNKHILIVAKNDPKNFSLIFELYGTSDGRVASITKPLVTNYKPPLPTVYQDDPTLPNGVVKQVDFAAAGARVVFDYKVVRGGTEIFKKTFVSNYQPWAAVYLRGTKI